MLAAGASEGDHEILEAAVLRVADAGVHDREHAGEGLVHAFLLVEIVDDRSVFAGESFEALFAAGIRETAAIEDEASAVTGIVLRQGLVKRKTENAHDEIVGFRGKALQFLRGQHAVKRAQESWEFDWQLHVMQEPTEIFQGVGDALEEMRFAFIEAAKTVGAERLHDANVNVGAEVVQ